MIVRAAPITLLLGFRLYLILPPLMLLYLHFKSISVEICDNSVFINKGLLLKYKTEILKKNISGVIVTRSAADYLFRSASVSVFTAAKSRRREKITLHKRDADKLCSALFGQDFIGRDRLPLMQILLYSLSSSFSVYGVLLLASTLREISVFLDAAPVLLDKSKIVVFALSALPIFIFVVLILVFLFILERNWGIKTAKNGKCHIIERGFIFKTTVYINSFGADTVSVSPFFLLLFSRRNKGIISALDTPFSVISPAEQQEKTKFAPTRANRRAAGFNLWIALLFFALFSCVTVLNTPFSYLMRPVLFLFSAVFVLRAGVGMRFAHLNFGYSEKEEKIRLVFKTSIINAEINPRHIAAFCESRHIFDRKFGTHSQKIFLSAGKPASFRVKYLKDERTE